MNNDQSQLISGISAAKSVLIIISANPPVDVAAAALSLFLVLNKQGKKTAVFSPQPPTAALSRLVGVDQITTQPGNKNLIISFDVPEETVEKVSYNYDNGKLNFIVEPVPGQPPPSQEKISFSYSGIDADLLLIVGPQPNQDLLNLPSSDLAGLPNQFHLVPASVPVNPGNQPPTIYSLQSALVIDKLGYALDEDSATNLLFGLDSATGNLSQNVNVDILETAARCLRAGAIRQSADLALSRPQPASFAPPARPFPPPRNPRPPFVKPAPRRFNPAHQPFIPVPAQPSTQPQKTDSSAPSVPPSPDWFEPKIYKGSSLL